MCPRQPIGPRLICGWMARNGSAPPIRLAPQCPTPLSHSTHPTFLYLSPSPTYPTFLYPFPTSTLILPSSTPLYNAPISSCCSCALPTPQSLPIACQRPSPSPFAILLLVLHALFRLRRSNKFLDFYNQHRCYSVQQQNSINVSGPLSPAAPLPTLKFPRHIPSPRHPALLLPNFPVSARGPPRLPAPQYPTAENKTQ
ncbi:hypothetical protein E2C01_003065 [Portunus trituberculatus]|uniref:Uncharacterized protein n=1 Tax=Portunus trituberculatus TaxID=210409 RepID=A0A5B7CLY0_PORTR|nr:hypothetical protein [Portunus trituberculatus]